MYVTNNDVISPRETGCEAMCESSFCNLSVPKVKKETV